MADGTFDGMAAQDTAHMARIGSRNSLETAHIADPIDGAWIATIGAEMFDDRTGKTGTVCGWVNPVRWDDARDKYLTCAPGHPAAEWTTVVMRWKDGSQEQISPASSLRCATASRADFIPPAPLTFLTFDEMVNLPDPEWLVEGLIVAGTSALMFGKSNSFKSFLAIDIACTIATARDRLNSGPRSDWHGHTIIDGGPVLYVATEGARGVAKQRIPGWMEDHGIPAADRQRIALYPQEIALDDDKAIDDLLRSAALHHARTTGAEEWADPAGAFKLVVIDIFGASMNGPETSDETARAWVRNINRIMREMKCAVLTVAHSGWADETRARMHTHFWGSFDTRLKADGDKESRTTVLSIDRHKDADSAGQWGFQLEVVPLSRGGTTLVPRLSDAVEKTQKRRVSGKPAVAMQALSEALIDHGHTISGPNYPHCKVVEVARWRELCHRHGLTDSDTPEAAKKAFDRAKATLLEKGLIRQFDGSVWKVEANA